MNPKNVVVLAVVPLPCNHFTVSVREPLALARNSGVIPDVWVAFIDNLISIGIDSDATDTHIETVCGVAP